jgi:hypothetical protein
MPARASAGSFPLSFFGHPRLIEGRHVVVQAASETRQRQGDSGPAALRLTPPPP